MNLSVIVGNGVDLANGMNTSYKSFYDSLTKEDIEQNKILTMWGEKWKETDNRLWSDLELFIGEASTFYTSYSDFKQDKEYIDQKLTNYLYTEQAKQKKSASWTEKENNYASFLDKLIDKLTDGKKRSLLNLINRKDYESTEPALNTTFINLNYTDTLERFLPITDNPNVTRDYVNNHSKYFYNFSLKHPEIIHLHGSLRDSIILGLNDASQFKKTEFDISNDIIIKRDAQYELRMEDFSSVYNNMWSPDLTVVIGAALGETDLYISELILNNLIRDPNSLVIIQHYINGRGRHMHTSSDYVTINRKYEKYFYQKIIGNEKIKNLLHNSDQETKNLLHRILVFIDNDSTENAGSLKYTYTIDDITD